MPNKHEYDRTFDAGVYDQSYFEGSGDKSGYTNYEQAGGMVKDQYDLINTVMANTIDHSQGKPKHLDLGCAYGFGVRRLAELGFDGLGFDISDYAIERARQISPDSQFVVGDARVVEGSVWDVIVKAVDKFDLITAVEFFEHIESEQVPAILKQCQRHGKWGVFVVNARTNPAQGLDESHGDHGHLNFHSMSWWITEFAKVGELDFDKMTELSVLFQQYNAGVHWHNRVIVIKFNEVMV